MFGSRELSASRIEAHGARDVPPSVVEGYPSRRDQKCYFHAVDRLTATNEAQDFREAISGQISFDGPQPDCGVDRRLRAVWWRSRYSNENHTRVDRPRGRAVPTASRNACENGSNDKRSHMRCLTNRA